jgi:putative ABC transport system permease protein
MAAPFRLFRFPWRSRSQIAQEVDEELAFHLEMRIAELTAAGVAPEEARRRAGTEFGDLEYTRAYCKALDQRTERGLRVRDRLADWRQDLRQAWRTIRRRPAFAAVSLLTLMLAIGANTAVFSVTRAVLLQPLPYGDPGSLVAVYESARLGPSQRNPLSVPNLVDYRAAQHTLTGLAAWNGRSVTWLPRAGEPELLDVLSVTRNTFDLLRVRPQLGRTFIAGDDAPGAAPIAVLSWEFWQRSLGGDPAIVGRTLTLNDLPYTVVGVMPRGFTLAGEAAMWTPLNLSRDLAHPEITRKQWYLGVIGRLRPGVSLATAEADLQAISRRLSAEYPEANAERTARVIPLHAAMVGDLQSSLLLLQAASALLLLIACVNLANVTLARTVGRRRELALRAALGAGRGRLVRQLLTESVLLALTGGALGIGMAALGTRALLSLQPGILPAAFDVHPDGGVLLFGLLLSLATGIGFGVLPAFDAARADVHGALAEGGRGNSGGRRGERVRRALVAAQVGIAVVLLVAAGLLVRSFAELSRVNTGFDPAHVLTAEVRVSGERYDDPALVNKFYDRVLQEIRESPGVDAAGATMKLPAGGWISSTLAAEGEPSDPARLPEVGFLLVRGDYFQALRVPLLAGRFFDERDSPQSATAVLINQAAARAYFPQGVPVGRRIRLGPDPTAAWSIVVGVVGDIREQGLDLAPAPVVYPNHVQNTWWRSLNIVIRTRGDPWAAVPLLRRAVRDADPTLALRNVRPMDEVLGGSLAARRFALGLVACFAGVALVLAAVGIYGVLAFSVTSRTREFGVRIALGATRKSVLLLVVGQGLAWSLLGLAMGVSAAMAGGRLLRGLLYGVTPADRTTFAVVTAALLLVMLVACLIPAARATRVDPIESMRAD